MTYGNMCLYLGWICVDVPYRCVGMLVRRVGVVLRCVGVPYTELVRNTLQFLKLNNILRQSANIPCP
jgi:hypothetical protein